MKVDMDMNRVLGRQPGPLTDRERAVRRLRESSSTVEVLAGEGLTIMNFVFDFDVGETPVVEYFCSTCGGHVLAYHVKIRGVVACPCGPMTGNEI